MLKVTHKLSNLVAAQFYLLLGVIVYAGNQQYVVSSAGGQAVMAPAYLPESVPHYVSSGRNYPNEAVVLGGAQTVSSTPYYPNKVVATEASTTWALQRAESVTYSDQEPPTAYQMKEEPGNAS